MQCIIRASVLGFSELTIRNLQAKVNSLLLGIGKDDLSDTLELQVYKPSENSYFIGVSEKRCYLPEFFFCSVTDNVITESNTRINSASLSSRSEGM